MRRLAAAAIATTAGIGVVFAAAALVFGHRWSWGGVPDWVNAIGTLGLLAGAVFTAVFAVQAFREQAKEVRLLEDQVAEQRALARKQVEVLSLQADEIRVSLENRRRDQAERIFTWVEPVSAERGHFVIHVTNESDRPVYSLAFLLGVGEDETAEYSSGPQEMKHLMPHATAVFEPDRSDPSILWGTSWEPDEVWSAVHFRDASGETWKIDSKGRIENAPGPWELAGARELRAGGAHASTA